MKNLVFLLFFLPLISNAQVSHTVAAKESLYSLARKYNVHPRELATFNNIPIETPLSIGQVIKIPAKTTMAPLGTPPPVQTEEPASRPVVTKVETKTETKTEAKKEGTFPVYHKVQKKETLYAISKQYPGLTIADIKKWNKLDGDGLSEGTEIIVGYSNSKTTTQLIAKEPVVKEADAKPVVTTTVPEPAARKEQPVVREEPVKNETVKKETPKEEVRNVTGKNFNGGAFKNLYEQQAAAKKSAAEEKGPGGIFKSTSGWEDGKYYCLTNTAPAGTIVKVTNNATQRSVYAKVLDLIPDLKQNTGMIIRISNAAAEELGATGDSFDCTLVF